MKKVIKVVFAKSLKEVKQGSKVYEYVTESNVDLGTTVKSVKEGSLQAPQW
jgi:hypothetical protein